MRRFRFSLRRCAAQLLLAGLLVSIAQGQPQLGNQLPNPRLGSITPCGGKSGTTFEMTFLGSDLDLPQALIFSHPGIKAVPFVPPPPTPDPKKPDQKPPVVPVTKFTVTIAPGVPVGIHD